MTTFNQYFPISLAGARSADFNTLGRGIAGRQSDTPDQTIGVVAGGSSYPITGAVVTTNVTKSGRLYMIFPKCTLVCGGSSSALEVTIEVLEDGVVIGRAGRSDMSSTGAVGPDVFEFANWCDSFSPSVATHTYSMRVTVNSIIAGSPTITVAGLKQINVVDMGAVS